MNKERNANKREISSGSLTGASDVIGCKRRRNKKALDEEHRKSDVV